MGRLALTPFKGWIILYYIIYIFIFFPGLAGFPPEEQEEVHHWTVASFFFLNHIHTCIGCCIESTDDTVMSYSVYLEKYMKSAWIHMCLKSRFCTLHFKLNGVSGYGYSKANHLSGFGLSYINCTLIIGV